MTPFNPTALVAMLLTFYPVVSGAALARARAERPEYFAGGTLIGRHGDALRLPDGVVWDLIFHVDGPAPRWQAIIPSGAPADAGGDPLFPLEAGPLASIDLARFPLPTPTSDFVPLVADAQRALGAVEAPFDTLQASAAGDPPGAAFDGAAHAHLGGAWAAVGAELRGLDAIRPQDLIATTAAERALIDARDGVWDAPAPPYLPTHPFPLRPQLPGPRGPGSRTNFPPRGGSGSGAASSPPGLPPADDAGAPPPADDDDTIDIPPIPNIPQV